MAQNGTFWTLRWAWHVWDRGATLEHWYVQHPITPVPLDWPQYTELYRVLWYKREK